MFIFSPDPPRTLSSQPPACFDAMPVCGRFERNAEILRLKGQFGD